MKLVYPACFYPEENGQYSVIFPDFGNATYGNSLDDALAMAEDLLGGMYALHKEDGDPLPDPSPIDSVVADEYPNGFVTLVHVDGDAYMKTHPTKTPKQLKLEKVTKFNDWVYRHLAWVNIALLVLLVLSWALNSFRYDIYGDKPVSIFSLIAYAIKQEKAGAIIGGKANPGVPFELTVFCLGCLSCIATSIFLFCKKPNFAPLSTLPCIVALAIALSYPLSIKGAGLNGKFAEMHVAVYLAFIALAVQVYQLFLLGTRLAKSAANVPQPAEPTIEKSPVQD